MDETPQIVTTVLQYLEQGRDLAESWLLSPAAWSQFALLIVAWVLAVLIERRLRPFLTKLITPTEGAKGALPEGGRFVLPFLALLLPLLAYALTGLGEQVTRSLFGSGAVIAFGKRIFLFLAARALVRDMLSDPFLKLMGRYVLLPVAALYALGLLEPASAYLAETRVGVGNI